MINLEELDDRLRNAITDNFREAGFTFHKETGEVMFISDPNRYCTTEDKIEKLRENYYFIKLDW